FSTPYPIVAAQCQKQITPPPGYEGLRTIPASELEASPDFFAFRRLEYQFFTIHSGDNPISWREGSFHNAGAQRAREQPLDSAAQRTRSKHRIVSFFQYQPPCFIGKHQLQLLILEPFVEIGQLYIQNFAQRLV